MCFSSDFLIEEADDWREECWTMMAERSDLDFIFLTKRIDRFLQCIPDDWNDGYDNVTVGCTVENQAMADHRLQFNYDWVLSLRAQCIAKSVRFEFRQCGTRFIKDGKEYLLSVRDLCSQARKANINWQG